jgi:hypothetical protein
VRAVGRQEVELADEIVATAHSNIGSTKQ